MRTILAVGAAVALLAFPGPARGQGAVGLVGGLNFGSIKGDAPDKISYGGRTGLIVGAVGEIALTDEVSLMVQPAFAQRGTSLLVEVEGLNEPVDSGSVSLSYISVPVLVRVMAGHRRTFVTGGLDFSFLSSATLQNGTAEDDIKDRLKSSDVAVNFGFGGVLRQGSPAVSLELRYAQSLTNLSNRDGSDPEDQLPVRFRSSGFQLLAGVLLPLGGAR